MRHREEAEDLVSEVVVTALVKRRLWVEGTNLRAWLFTIMHNTAVNEWRQFKRQESLSWEISAPPPTADPEAHAVTNDVIRALENMPSVQREVMQMLAIEGVQYGKASQVLGVPVGTVRSRLSRARASLRKAVDR